MDKKERIKEIFVELSYSDTDWSYAADLFIRWNVDNDFQTESFNEFVDWIMDEQINDIWGFFFGYDDNFEKFADDWVTEEEKESYLEYVKKYV
jgi:hypothetical protein